MTADIKNKKFFLEYENMEVWFQMFSFFYSINLYTTSTPNIVYVKIVRSIFRGDFYYGTVGISC